MRTASHAAVAALAVLGLALACRHSGPLVDTRETSGAGGELSAEERAKRDCRASFAACAPPISLAPDANVDDLGVRSLVQISWRMDLDDRFTERAAKRLRKLAESGDLETVREIAVAGENAASTLGRCRCTGEKFRTQWEVQNIGTIAAGRLPPAEMRTPSYWANRIDPHVAKLRALSRRSAALAASGDDDALAGVNAEVRAEHRALCENLHAARDVLSDDGMSQARALVYQARGRESGDASIEVAQRELERAERQPSCATEERPDERPDATPGPPPADEDE
jgi:hypothetical protein